MTQYNYITIHASHLFGLFVAPEMRGPDSYAAMDQETKAILSALNQGYRWIRTDNEMAVFEKQHQTTPAVVRAALDENDRTK